jgi:sec-independent protein translocase protein TatB
MFDIGFSELVMIALVALVVIGPERLPKAARVAGMWVGRARRTLTSVKQEIDRELKANELNEILKRQTHIESPETILEEPLKPPASPAPNPPQAPASPVPAKSDAMR